MTEAHDDIFSEVRVPLSDIAEILKPRAVQEPGYVLGVSDFKYPFPKNLTSKEKTSDVTLAAGDIVVALGPSLRAFLVTTEPEYEVRAGVSTIVVRPQKKNIDPFYLAQYLSSYTALEYAELRQQGAVLPRLTISQLRSFQVVIPSLETQSQARQVFKRLFMDTRPNIDEINRYLYSPHEPINYPIQELFIDEIVAMLGEYKIRQLSELLNTDFSEINRCFKVHAYKSCIILSGSIMEAVLLDWLSEVEKTDYLSSNNLKLYEVIGRLKEQLGHAYDKAEKIRKSRNLIHPEKFLKASAVIDEPACREVLDDLKVVLRQRGLITGY